jgi:hypothetical protein
MSSPSNVSRRSAGAVIGIAYYRNMTSSDLTASAWFVERKGEQENAHDGQALLATARARCAELPAGPVTLVAMSAEGVALAGAIVALRDQPTSWRQVKLRSGTEVSGAVALIEMVVLGEGLRTAVLDRYPGVMILDGPAPLRSTADTDTRLARAA